MDQRTASNAICDACGRQYIDSSSTSLRCTRYMMTERSRETQQVHDEGTYVLLASNTYIYVLVINN